MNQGARTQLKRDYFWNTAGGIMTSLSTVLITIVVTRVNGVAMAGLVGLAIAVGMQLQALGTYEVRTYQATDVRGTVSFGTYHATRIVTVLLMLLGLILFPLVMNQSPQDYLLLVLIAALRLIDAFEDVFFGEWQRENRLDIAGRAYFWRVFATTAMFCVVLLMTRDVLLTTLITLATAIVMLVALVIVPARGSFAIRPDFTAAPIRALLATCLPLFLAAFLSTYLVNAPRFAIGTLMTNEVQGYFTFVFLPAFVITLLSALLFRPLLTRMANRWSEADVDGFRTLVWRGLQGAAAAFLLTFAATYFLGVPVLNLVYGVDVAPYKTEMLVLLVGAGASAASTILYYALTILRRQRMVFFGYALAALVVLVLSYWWVSLWGMMGAALSFAAAMIVLVVTFVIAVQYYRGRVVPGESLNAQNPTQ